MHVSSLSRLKDQPTLLKAFRIIHSTLLATHLSVVGEDMLSDAVQHQARLMDLDEAASFHGARSQAAVAKMLRTAHVLILSSMYEDAGPLAVLEAAACGVPTVGTAVGLAPELAPDAAVVVPPGDHNALADAVVELLRDEPRRISIAARAREFALEHDAAATAREFEALYAELAGVAASTTPAGSLPA